MEYISNTPMMKVDDVVFELGRLSGLCHLMTQLQDQHDTIDMVAVGQTMGILRDSLDKQIQVLDSIKWSAEKAVTA